MRPSNLQLKRYFITELHLTANEDFDPEKEVRLRLEDVLAEPECIVREKHPREWQIRLRVRHAHTPESNSPYNFAVEIVGFFRVHEDVPDESVEKFARVNGSSILFTTAREVLRSSMANGPFDPIVLPTVCFFDPPLESTDAKGKQGERVAESTAQ
jgi:preprotein translocase subunit SecB